MTDLSRGAPALRHRAIAELVGTTFLVAAVVGSGIAAQRLSPDDVGLQLLENALATGAALAALIIALQPVSAAFNPVVTALERLTGAVTGRHATALIAAQILGGLIGVVVANLMFSEPAVSLSTTERGGPGRWLGEVVATAGLVLLITALSRTGRPQLIGWAVGAYITAGYWFTSSTSFANPAVTSPECSPTPPLASNLRRCRCSCSPRLLEAPSATVSPGLFTNGRRSLLLPRRIDMNSTPPQTTAPGAEPSGQPARGRVTDYDRLVDDLAYTYEGIFSRNSIARAVADAREALEPTATVPNFLPILVSRFARERLTAAAQADGRLIKPVPELLFVCVQNAGRSQMAAALAQHLSAGKVHVRSAGSKPADKINPMAVQVLAERGITLTEAYPKPLTNDVVHAADVIVTMGCGDACPIYPGKRYLDWDVADPNDEPIDKVRDIRDDLQARITALLRDLNI